MPVSLGHIIRRALYVNGADVSAANPLPVTGGGVAFPIGVAGTPNAGVLTVQGIAGGTAQPVVLTAGTAQAGLVTAGGFTSTVQVTPTVQIAAYTAGQCVGGLITLANAARVAAGSGLIQAVTASFISGVVPSLDIIFFNANPTGSTTTDKTALAIATADLGKIIGIMHLTDATLLGATTPSWMQSEQQAMPFKLPSGTSLFASVVTRTGITLVSVADMTVSANLLQD